MKKTLTPLLILFSFGFICQNFGPISYDLSSLLVLTLLLIYFFVSLPIRKESAFSIPLFFICSLLVARLDNTLVQLTGLSAILFALNLYSQWRGYSKDEHAVSLVTTVLFTAVFFLYEYFPEGWYAVENCASFFSSVCTFVYSRTLHLGPTAFGFFIFVSFVIYHAVLFILDKKRSTVRFIISLVYLFCISVVFVGINILIDSIVKKYTFAVMRSDLNTQALLFLMMSLSFLFQRKREFTIASILPAKRMYKYAIPCFALFTASLVLYTWPLVQGEPVDLKTVKFYKQGSLDWKTARFGDYGKRSGGMFGIMPRYLKAVGFRSRMIDTISPVTLAGADVLVMINLNKGLNREELLTVWNFVKHGGGLLLLGDHTNLGGLMENFNVILKVVPLKFKFDSAMPSRYTWDYLMDIRPHPLTNGFKREITRSWWVGASLECRAPAVPLVIGKYCYSDWGYKHNKKRAYLGNRRFDYYERQNDVVLAACTRYGKGKIMVCGDTSAFHNTTFMTTHPFVVNTFNLLSNRDTGLGPVAQNIIKAVLVLSIVGCVLLIFVSVPNVIVPAAFIMLLCSVVSFTSYAERRKQIREIPYEKLEVAYIDYSHNGRFDLMSWEDDSIGGLKNNLMRNRFYPFLLRDFEPEKLMQAKVLLIIAPTKPFTEHEVMILKDFVRSGGRVLLSVGWEEKEASVPILKSFNMDIDNVPLAWCEYEYERDIKDTKYQKDKKYKKSRGYKKGKKYKKSKKTKKGKKPGKTTIQFREAWPVVFDSRDDVKVICRPLDYPAIVSKKFGRGSITVIADSKFLLNENLEGDEKYYVPNMFLLRDLLLK